MTWRKYFTPSPTNSALSPISGNHGVRPGPAQANYSSYLPDVYMGAPNRVDRYQQYEVMDSDPEINAALDILAEFCTQKLKDNKSPFSIKWRHPGTNNEVRILAEYLQQWNTLQRFDTRIFRIVRNTFKYGDSFFIRDPETQSWSWIDPSNVVKIIGNESDGKKPEQYIIKDLAPNFEHLVATQITTNVNPRQMSGGLSGSAGNFSTSSMTSSGVRSATSASRFGLNETEYAINAEHVVHLSLSEGLDNNYPFGNSLLENIFKVYKQKELLEDAILIYRIQRAPERRVFHIDVGNMPGHMAMAFVERVKNEIHQRRIPSQCLTLDTKILLLDGRILPLETLIKEYEAGKENWVLSCSPTGQIAPGIISWAGITGTNKQILRLVFSNGTEVTCTPEHKFPILGKGFVEARNLNLGETFITAHITKSHVFNQRENTWDTVEELFEVNDIAVPTSVKTGTPPTDTPDPIIRLIYMEYLPDTDTVGTLTIDGDEKYHNYHTFLLENGVFTKNSGGGCFTMHTKVPLLDGRLLTIQELSNEFYQGKINWAYSCDPTTLSILPGKITWAGVTHKSAQILELTLDDGEIIQCTPDHKFPVIGKGKVEAKDIIPLQDKLIKFNAWDYTTTDLPYFLWDTSAWMASMNRKEGATKTVVSIKYLDEPTTVGTVTIDGNEELHGHHTFAIEQGIYTYNSNVIDSAYNPLCISVNTEIPLLDGRVLPLHKIIEEFEQGKENWVYSCDPVTGKIAPGIIDWAGITKYNTPTVKVTLDNKKFIICTPDHKFPVFGKGFVEAQYLTPNDELIYANLQSNNDIHYIWDHSINNWITTHDMVGSFLKNSDDHNTFTFFPEHKDADKTVLHHADGNVANNSPNNLVYMSKEDHLLYHMTQSGYEMWGFNDAIITDDEHILNKCNIISVTPHAPCDVGTITVDKYEKWHNYHTFAVNSGIFIKNSINEDYFFPKTCLSLTEKIALLDGRDVTLADIITEYNDGKDNWVYTVNQHTHEIEVGKIEWAGITRQDTQVIKVTLDNGNVIKVTPDHRFIMRDGTEKEAQHLITGDQVMPLYLHTAATGKNQGADKYLRFTCNKTGKKKWVHTMVCPKSTPGREVEIHHIDCNSRNNNPTNLVEMSMSDHRALHREMGSYYLSRAWNTPASRDQLINGIRQYHASVTPEDKLMFKERGRKNGAKTWTNPETREKLQEVLKNNRNIIKERKSINYTTAMGERLIELYNNGFNTVHKMIAVLRDDEPYQTAFKEANQSLVKDRNRPFKSFPDSTRLGKILQTVGYNSWSEFKETYRYNHSITSIEWLSTTEDTGDITVSSINNNHNFALSSGVFVHNSEGRGSSVDTLPGGTALGEISDLKFFTNKLFRGLRIPSSYLPTGADDSQASFNDGRVGTAYIQELRFNKYCERLQTLITEKFDTEFKMYMYTRGLNVDANIFELQFNPPMNFASSRQSAVDAERINTFNTIQGVPYIAKRFALKRFLGLTDEELAENERLYGEESGSGRPTQTDAAGELRSAGLSAAEIEDELGGVEDLTVPEDLGILPDEEGTANNPPISP